MKKLLISISLLLVLVVAIVACNNNESEEPTSGSTTPQVTETPTEDETEPPTSKPEETTPPKDDEDPTTPPKDDEDPTTKEEETTVEEETGWSEVANVPGMSPDTYYENGSIVNDGSSHTWLQTNRPDGIIVDSLTSFGFRGWAGLGDKQIAEFGYALGNDGEAVWNTEWVLEAEDGLASASGQPNVKRYEIMIDTADIKGGEYDLYLLAKATDDTVYRLNVWGDIKVVRTVYEEVSDVRWHSSVDMINGKGETSDSPNFSGAGGNSLNDPTCDTVEKFVQPTTPQITVQGWLGITGGVNKYIWTVDGETWFTAQGGSDGEPVEGHYASNGMENALKNGLFKDDNVLVADLSAYKWQTVDVTFAAVSEADNTKIATFLTIKGVKVPGGTERPDMTTQSKVDLGKGGQGNPMCDGGAFGQKFTIAEGQWLDVIEVYNMATYDKTDTVGTFKVWIWDTDYATTVAKDPIFSTTIENHVNCKALTMDVSALNISNCTVYYEAQATGEGDKWTPWIAKEGTAEGVEVYLNGQLFDQGYLANITVSSSTTDELLYDVDFDKLDNSAVTGHAPGLQAPDSEQAAKDAKYTNKWAKIHQGNIYLGELDLSLYKYVKIRYAFDGSATTQAEYDKAESTKIGLVNDNVVNFADASKVIASTDYVVRSGGWSAPDYAIIDLSEVTYNGAVYVTIDSLPGTFYGIDAIEFYGVAASEEETPDAGEENPDTPDAGEDTSGEEAEA